MSGTTPSPKRWRVTVAKTVVTCVLLWLTYRRADLGQLRSIYQQLDAVTILLAYGVMFLNTTLSALKWKLLLSANGLEVRLSRLIASYLIGTFFNLFLPSSIGGDVYRVYDLARHGGSTENATASVLADRITGLLALVSLGLLFSVVGYSRLQNRQIVVCSALLFLGMLAGIWMVYQQRWIMFLLRRLGLDRSQVAKRFVANVFVAFTTYRQHPGLLRRVMGISFLFQFSAIFGMYLIARAVGLQIPLMYLFIIVPIVNVMEILPISIYGIGVRDAGYAFFFLQVGHTRVEALSLSLALVAMTLTYSLLGGVLFLARRPSAPSDRRSDA